MTCQGRTHLDSVARAALGRWQRCRDEELEAALVAAAGAPGAAATGWRGRRRQAQGWPHGRAA
jgi:hypothetical protein